MSINCCEKLIGILRGFERVECFEKKTSAEEKDKKFLIENKSNKNICRVKIDNCFINSLEEIKCDYMFAVLDTHDYLLVELKGRSGISHAIDQINNTYRIVNNLLKLHESCFKGYIVATCVPAVNQRNRNIIEQRRRQSEIRIEISSRVKKLTI